MSPLIACDLTISRPKKVDDVVQQDEVVSTLRKSIETGNVWLDFSVLLIAEF
jgi:hypothetical protein